MTEPVHQPGFPSLLCCPKPHKTACSIASLQEKWENSKVGASQESISSLHLHGTWEATLRATSSQGSPQPGTATKKEMKSQRLSLWCLTEHKNPALKTKTRKRRTGRAAREERGSDAQPQKNGRGRCRGSPHTNTHLHGRRVSQENKCKVCYKSLSARKSERA